MSVKELVKRPFVYKSARPEVYGGKSVKVLIKRGLLRKPAGEEAFAVLQLNRSKIYLKEGDFIAIGSSPKCDVMIKDPAMEGQMLGLSYSPEEGVSLEYYGYRKNSVVVENKKGERAALEPSTVSTSTNANLGESGAIFLKLSGSESLSFFEIKFGKEQPFLDEIRQVFEARPPVKQISVGEAEEGAPVGLQPMTENASISLAENDAQVKLAAKAIGVVRGKFEENMKVNKKQGPFATGMAAAIVGGIIPSIVLSFPLVSLETGKWAVTIGIIGWLIGKFAGKLADLQFKLDSKNVLLSEFTPDQINQALLKSDAETQKCVRSIMGKDLPLLGEHKI